MHSQHKVIQSRPLIAHTFNHADGTGFVAAHAGHYADALAKRRQVCLCLVETTGAIHQGLIDLLGQCADEVATRDGAPGVQDRTKYGVSRAATHSHFTHHLRRISLAAVTGTVQPLARWAKSTLSRILIRATPNPSNLAGEFLSTMPCMGA